MGTVTKEKSTPLHEGREVTREEYLDLQEDGFKYDMIDGVLHLTPAPDFGHGEAQISFGGMLARFVKSKGLGRTASEADIMLPDGGDALRPDISFVGKDRLNIISRAIHGAPDLVVEILSPSTFEKDLGRKAERYRKSGVKEYWLLDPRDKTIQVWNNRGDEWEKRAGGLLKSELLTGFQVAAKDVFG